jgi:hypothetical protein
MNDRIYDAPPDEAFFMPDDPFETDWAGAWDAAPEPLTFVEVDELFGEEPPQAPGNDERWAWHDARLVGVYREGELSPYEIGCIDLYAEADGRDLAGSYLPIASFAVEDVATAFYHDGQGQADERWLAKAELPTFALEQAQAFDPAADWRPASRDEIDAYEFQRDLELAPAIDLPPPELDDPLLARAAELGGVMRPTFDDPSAFHALHEIGLDSQGFNPQHDPPPFYDAETGTAYWIGVFQPDKDDPEHCVTSILSLGRTDDGYEAQLAPCAPGDWDKAHEAAEFLIAQAQKGGIERAFDAAEGMALATGERALWDAERGLALDDVATQDLADYASQWEIDR